MRALEPPNDVAVADDLFIKWGDAYNIKGVMPIIQRE
jgi:hypothetical protein